MQDAHKEHRVDPATADTQPEEKQAGSGPVHAASLASLDPLVGSAGLTGEETSGLM